MKKLLFIDDLENLREKLTNMPLIWQKRWRRFCASAQEEQRNILWYGVKSTDVPLHATFAWLITEEQEFLNIAKRDVDFMLDNYEQTLKDGYQEQDTWMYAAPKARRAIGVDWLWHSGIWSDNEKQQIKEHFITDSLKYPYVVLHHRVPAHADNQGLAMSLNCSIVGYLWGVKLDNDPLAKHLLRFGLTHLLQQIAFLPPGGYGGEGSAYINVADPLMALACAFLEEISAENWFTKELAPSGNSCFSAMDLTPKLTLPSCTYPGLDQHGYQLSVSGTTNAYLAKRMQRSEIYNRFIQDDVWNITGRFAWMRDDHVWQWVFMPKPEEPSCSAQAHIYPDSWIINRVGGGLKSDEGNLHCFQWWDIVSSFPVRLHNNPNAIEMQAWGSQLTVDGNGTDDYPLNKDPRFQYKHYYSEQVNTISWAAGTLASHSVITVDDDFALHPIEDSYENRPDIARTGNGFNLEDTPEFKVMRSDVKRLYDFKYDITKMVRSTALIDNAIWVIHDHIMADSSHKYHWQLVARKGVTDTSYGQRLRTAEHVVMDIFHLDNFTTEVKDIEGYPSTLECQCHHITKQTQGQDSEFLTLMIPQKGRKKIIELAHWQGAWGDDLQPSEELQSVALNEVVDMGPHNDKNFWLQHKMIMPKQSDKLYLKVARPYVFKVWINDQELEQTIPLDSKTNTHLYPEFIELPSDICGECKIDICYYNMGDKGLIDNMAIYELVEPTVPTIEHVDANMVKVNLDGQNHELDLQRIRTYVTPELDMQCRGANIEQEALKTLETLNISSRDRLNFKGSSYERTQSVISALDYPLAEVEKQLLLATKDEDSWLIKELAVRTLGELRSLKSLPRLYEVLAEEDSAKVADVNYAPRYRIKEMAVYAIGLIGCASSCKELCALMDYREFYGVRRICAEVLGVLGNKEAIPTLQKWVNDSDGETANAAKSSIKKLTEV